MRTIAAPAKQRPSSARRQQRFHTASVRISHFGKSLNVSFGCKR
jgi:hypothetical protein